MGFISATRCRLGAGWVSETAECRWDLMKEVVRGFEVLRLMRCCGFRGIVV